MKSTEMNVNSIESLKAGYLSGYLFFTDAWLHQTQEVLLKIGFRVIPEAPEYVPGMRWYRRDESGTLRIHLANSTKIGADIAAEELAAGMRTRVDFFYHRCTDAAHDVARSLIEIGHRVMAQPVEKEPRSAGVGGFIEM